MTFEANLGQAPASAKYIARTPGSTAFLEPTGVRWVVSASPGDESDGHFEIGMRFAGGNPAPFIRGDEPLATRSNYFSGDDPSAWVTDVPHDTRVIYEEVWPGIDAVFYGVGTQLEYDFIVAPGADPSQIALAFEGASQVEIADDGRLVARTDDASVEQAAPTLYQTLDGERMPVEGRFALKDATTVGFDIGTYDASSPLVIDPRIYATYVGDLLGDGGSEIAIDSMGAAYITGSTLSLGFTSYGSCSAQCTNGGGYDAFAVKVNPTGSTIVYWTFLGGTGRDFGQGIDVDPTGAAYVTGWTQSPNFPIVGPVFGPTPPGMLAPTRDDAFITKLSPAGAIVYSTFLGHSSDDEVFDIAVDANGFAYVAGSSASPLFPTTALAYDTTHNGNWDVFVTKIDQTASAIVWSTWIGGSSYDRAQAISVDALGNVYVTGWTLSANYPLAGTGALPNAGGTDAILSRLSPSGSVLACSTHYGGALADRGWDIEVDSTPTPRYVWITGDTTSVNLNVASLFQNVFAGVADAFVVKSRVTDCVRTCSTYLGGVFTDEARGIALVPINPRQAWVTGGTASIATFPITGGAFQPTYGGGTGDAFLTRIECVPDPTGGETATLSYSSYYGGPGSDRGGDVDVNGQLGAVPIVGFTGSTTGNFPVSGGAADTSFGGPPSDGWVLVCANVC